MRSIKITLCLALFLALVFLIYTADYYRADTTAADALTSGGGVTVSVTDYGWHFDGPADDTALIFYPGAKVEAAAYAPLLRQLAEGGVDACLVNMPFRLAILDIDRADAVMAEHDYAHWYVGGHSMGGAVAAMYAERHSETIDGVILCAAYPTGKLDDALTEIQLYGSEDRILNRHRLEKGREYAPSNYFEHVIQGGNHAQFGCYGVQKGDGTATISGEEQRSEAVEFILTTLLNGPGRDETGGAVDIAVQ